MNSPERNRSQPAPEPPAFRFGVIAEAVRVGRDWTNFAKEVEARGIDVLISRDHFAPGPFGRQLAPLPALAAAAAVTRRVHLGTMVLSNDFRHPAMVAHEAATLQHLSEGRFELGIGAGWYEPEYRTIGLPFDPPALRIDRLEQALDIITRLFAGQTVSHTSNHYRIDSLNLDVLPALGTPPRILVGGGGQRMLALAAQFANTIGILPAPIRDSVDRDDPQDRLPTAFDAKIRAVTAAAGPRVDEIEISALVTIVVTDNRRAATQALIADRGWNGVTPETVWEMPTVLVGSLHQIKQDLLARRERHRLSYLISTDSDVVALGELAAAMS